MYAVQAYRWGSVGLTYIAFFLPLYAGGKEGFTRQERAEDIFVQQFQYLRSQGIEDISLPFQRSFDEFGLPCDLPSRKFQDCSSGGVSTAFSIGTCLSSQHLTFLTGRKPTFAAPNLCHGPHFHIG